MKKILLIFFTFLILPVYANNTLQIEAENLVHNKYANLTNTQLLSLFIIVMIQNDYLIYEYDKSADTIYQRLIEEKNTYCDSLNNDDIVKCGLAKQIQKKYLEINNFTLDKKISKFAKDFNKDKIVVDDEQYKNLSKTFKTILRDFSLIKN